MFLPWFIGGFGAGALILSPAEWLVHKYMLHTPKSHRTWINRKSSYAHHDVHHAAYRGPEHYYRDITNENQVIHFNSKDVATILGVGGALGAGTQQAYALAATGALALTVGTAGAALGMMAASTVGYLGYEVFHHYMHVIGERRLAINRAFGDRLQESRDGKLRFTKPLLDDICNSIEEHVDANVRGRYSSVYVCPSSLEERFAKQVAYNRDTLKNNVLSTPLNEILADVADKAVEREREIRQSKTGFAFARYWIDRKAQRLFRGSDTFVGRYFRHIDNHHFMHHSSYTKNLNVFLTWADYAFGTKIDSSKETLDILQKRYAICPNSPDIGAFRKPSC